MNPADLILILVILLLIAGAVWYMRTHKGCTSDCASCKAHCSSRGADGLTLVERYRKDHPKEENIQPAERKENKVK